MDEQTLQKLKTMLDVPIERVEETDKGLIVYVPKDKIGRAVGQNGLVVRAAELVLGIKLEVRPAT
ncbi:MAG: hypothetical protein QXU01_00005 [Candidatus Hadarchaeales archaeon]